MAYTDTQFLEKIKPLVIADMRTTKILASLTASQAFIESNKGNSGLTQKANNLFGIKGTYNGQSVTMQTTEYYNGVATKVNAAFRKYPSWVESIADHSGLFNRSSRYANLRGLTDYNLACKYVREDGYATSPTYTSTLLNVINKYRLYEWDAEALGDTDYYVVGKTYTLDANLFIRTEPYGDKIKMECITVDARNHSKFDDYGNAILLKGTRVTCKAIDERAGSKWLLIPSGWVCAEEGSRRYIIM